MQPDHIWIILCALGSCILSIGGLIAWVIKTVVPRVLDGFEKKNQSLTFFIEKTSLAVEKISESIASIEKSILGVEQRVIIKVDEIKDEVIEEIRNDKLEKLAEKIDRGPVSRTGSHPSLIACDGLNNGKNSH